MQIKCNAKEWMTFHTSIVGRYIDTCLSFDEESGEYSGTLTDLKHPEICLNIMVEFTDTFLDEVKDA